MTNNRTINFDDIMTAIIDYATALKSDSPATDSTLDELQMNLDFIFEHDQFADDPDYADDLLDINRESFDAFCFHELNPELSDSTIDSQIESLRTIANNLFNLRA